MAHELLDRPLDDLLTEAATVRDLAHGRRVTYSPKVFIPLTRLCRDRCGYCTFATAPARVEAAYLSPDEVLAIATAGAEAGCHEALFTLGERPEERYPAARAWLDEHGYASTVDYLEAMCGLVLAETGLLPHANAGALHPDELAVLRAVAPSQGMMLETLADLACHEGSPDKEPARRLATLEAAGELGIAFTTGILVGIGETRDEIVDSLFALRDLTVKTGAIQEVIVQNFRAKADTPMRHSAEPAPRWFARVVAVARWILGAEANVQVPPNLTEHFEIYLDAGINDWGGVSPLTIDWVNPEAPWPHLDVLRERTEAAGFELRPRLPVYPEFIGPEWIDPGLLADVVAASDDHGLALDQEKTGVR
jgi:FO synthase